MLVLRTASGTGQEPLQLRHERHGGGALRGIGDFTMASHQSLLPRRALALFVAMATAVLGLGALTVAPAAAATDPTYNVVDRPASAVTADALPTVQIDGVVWDQAIYRDTVFAGGQFNNARPAGAAAGTNQTPRSNLLAYNIRTGVLITSFAPSVNGTIKTMAVSGDGTRLYIGGTFTSVNGVTRNRLAAVNVSDGSLVSSFAPTVSNQVNAISLATVGGSEYVYFGGTFGSVNGVGRNQLAAVDGTGKLRDWRPVASSTVNSLTRTPDSKSIIIGGMFATINGISAPGLASVDSTTGVLFEDFAASKVIKDYGDKAGIYSLKTDGTNVYGTGYWFGGTAGNFEGPFVIDPYTGTIKWMADCHGDTYDTSVVGTTVYSVSHQHDCSNINGFPDPGSAWHRSNAFTLAATTTVRRNNNGNYYNFEGQPAPSLVNWFPDVPAGTFTGQSQGGWTSESTSEYLVQGGEFPSVNGTAQQGLVRFAVPTIAPNKQGARVSAADSKPTLRAISGTNVRVSWPTNWDRDDQSLTYKLYRTDKPATPLSTQTATSQFWNRPVLSYLDSGLTPSTAYSYYVVVSDSAPTPNTLKSSTSTVATGTNTIDSSAYSQAVTADGASHYWRLDDAAGTAATDFAGSNDLVLGSGATLGTAGAIGGSDDPAATFDGTPSGTAGTTTTEPGTDTFTIEAWFKSTSTSGGKIIGFGDSQLGTSNNYDRHIYLDNSGRVVAGVCCSQGVSTVASDNSYNDGAWHQVVASLSTAGLKLYVDGLQEGADPGVTLAQPYAGYWRVGGDNLNAWPYDHSSSFVSSSIDDVAVYPTALTLTQVRDHYTKSGRTAAVVTAPTDPYGKAVYEDNPSLFWRLDEQVGTTVKDSSPSRVTGDAFGGVTFGAASTVSPGTAASFDGSDGTTVSSRKQFSNPTTYSEEVWFNTTTTAGGKLIGFGNQRSGNSSSYDRHVYMENSGQLTYGVYTGQLNVVTSPSAYNDGRWHQVVATQDGTDGMKLYVDGALVGTNGQTQAQGYDGYWRVGGDSSWAASNYFAGSIDEVAVYPTALSASKVRSHYLASPAAVNAAPVASFQTTCTDDSCSVDATDSSDADGSVVSYAWDFGDGGTASTKTASHTYKATGDYTITLTVTDDGGKTGQTTHSVHAVVANRPPVAAFVSSCADLSCTFDASTSSDPDGTLASYTWAFGDGSTATGAKPSHPFATGGSYNVVLTVTDDKGATDSVTHAVTVKAANQSPTAAFTSTVAGLKVSVDATASSDPDGTIASYAWTYGDGGTGTGRTDTHTYAAAGTYSVKLVVTDNDGGTDSSTKTVSVTAAATTVAADNFNRSGTRWGTADTGGVWTDTTSFTTNGAKGVVTIPRAGSGPVASLNAVSVLNSSTKVDFAFDKPATGTGGSYLILSSRRSGSNEVRLKARLMADGSVRLSAWTVVAGTETLSGKEVVVAGLTYTAGDVLSLRFDVSGTTTTSLSGKIWPVAAAEPTSFPLVSTTTVAEAQSAGSVAVQGYLSASATNAPVVLTVDNYVVNATP